MSDDLGPLPTLHPRHEPTSHALQKLVDFLHELEKEFELSSAEYLLVLAEATAERLHSLRRTEWRRQREEVPS